MNSLQIETGKAQHTREARRIEQVLNKKQGVNHVSVSASGIIQLEWDAKKTNQADILESIKKLGLSIVEVKNSDQQSEQNDHHHHAPAYLQFLGENTELYFAVTSGVFWILGLIFSFVHDIPENLSSILFIIGAVFGGFFTFITAGKDILRGKFEIDFLMLFAAIGAGALGKWGEAALLLFLFQKMA